MFLDFFSFFFGDSLIALVQYVSIRIILIVISLTDVWQKGRLRPVILKVVLLMLKFIEPRILEDLLCIAVPLIRTLFEQPLDELPEFWRRSCLFFTWKEDLSFEYLSEHIVLVLTIEGCRPDEQLVDDHAYGPPIGSLV